MTEISRTLSTPETVTTIICDYLYDSSETQKKVDNQTDLVTNEVQSIVQEMVCKVEVIEPKRVIEKNICSIFSKIILENYVSRVIFLDVDGVLLDEAYYEGKSDIVMVTFKKIFPYLNNLKSTSNFYHLYMVLSHFLGKDAIKYLQEALDYKDRNEDSSELKFTAIVLSSHWRLDFSVSELRKIFAQHPFAKYILDKTPGILTKIRERALEIAEWLSEHPFIQSFAIVDDHDDPNRGLSKYKKRFVKTSPADLFSKTTLEKVLRAFQVEVPYSPDVEHVVWLPYD